MKWQSRERPKDGQKLHETKKVLAYMLCTYVHLVWCRPVKSSMMLKLAGEKRNRFVDKIRVLGFRIKRNVDYHLEEGLLVRQVDKMTVNLNEGKEEKKGL